MVVGQGAPLTARCIHGSIPEHCTTCRTKTAETKAAERPASSRRPSTTATLSAVAAGGAQRIPSIPAPTEMNALGRTLGATSIRTVPVAMLSTGRLVQVPTFLRIEKRWTGELPKEHKTIPNKAALDFEGVPTYPEFVLLRLLERDGWEGAWRKNWAGTAFWGDIGLVVEPSPRAQSIFEQIDERAGFAGAWDILAWRGSEVLFLTSKPTGNDRIGAYQARWLDTALGMGMPLHSFAIVEYQV
jgi:hypothetical protein